MDERTPWAHAGGRAFSSLSFPKRNPLYISAAELQDFRAFFTCFGKVNLKTDRFLRVAIDRFHNALDRQSIEDSVIDLSICLEAMLLSGLGNEEDRGNISYRFALHGARLLAYNPANRKEIFRKLKGVYGIRSKIVHGANAYHLPKDNSGKEISIEQYCDSLEELARSCFRKFLSQLERTGNSCQIDWSSVVLD
jgi:hypothetical protein